MAVRSARKTPAPLLRASSRGHRRLHRVALRASTDESGTTVGVIDAGSPEVRVLPVIPLRYLFKKSKHNFMCYPCVLFCTVPRGWLAFPFSASSLLPSPPHHSGARAQSVKAKFNAFFEENALQINAFVNIAIVGSVAFGAFFRIVEVDSDISTGWTWYEILRNIPEVHPKPYILTSVLKIPTPHPSPRTLDP